MKNRTIIGMVSLLCLALLLAAIPLLGGCAPKEVTPTPPAERPVVRVDCGCALTGPYAGTTVFMIQGWNDFWKWVEEVEGGITVKGKKYKVEAPLTDTKMDPALAVSTFKRAAAAGSLCYSDVSTPTTIACRPVAEKLGVPLIMPSSTKDILVPFSDWCFAVAPTYPGSMCTMMKWYKENRWKGEGKMKVGMLVWDTGYGHAFTIPEVKDYLELDLGVELLPYELLPFEFSDATPNLLRLKEEGADAIFLGFTAGPMSVVLKDAYRLGMKSPKPQFFCSFYNVSKTLVDLAGEASEGMLGMWQYSLWPYEDDEAHPGVKRFCDRCEKFHNTRLADESCPLGATIAQADRYALELALEKHGYPITPEDMLDGFKSMGPRDVDLVPHFQGYAGGNDRCGFHDIRVVGIENGKVVIISDWFPEAEKWFQRAPWIRSPEE